MGRGGFGAIVLLVLGSLVLVASCSSGSGTPSGGGGSYCSRGINQIQSCGFKNFAASVSGECEEPTDAEERCLFDCFLGLSCQSLVNLYCHNNFGILETCASACEPPPFVCGDGSTISASGRCDGWEDCADGSDEADCPKFTCGDGTTIPLDYQCDGGTDCADGSDEAGCPGVEPPFDCGNGEQYPQSFVCDGEPDCSNGADEAGCPPPGPDPLEADCAALGVPRGP